MEYQKIANILESTSVTLSKFKTRNLIEINDESKGSYANSEIRFKTTMLRSDLCDLSDLCTFIYTCKSNKNNHWSRK